MATINEPPQIRLFWTLSGVLVLWTLMAAEAWFDRRLVQKVFARDTGEGPNLADINIALTVINEKCGSHTFCADRSGSVQFCGQRLILTWGRIGSLGTFRWGPIWNSTKCFFALAELTQVDWMKAKPEAFTSVYEGTPYSVFVVRTSALKSDLGV